MPKVRTPKSPRCFSSLEYGETVLRRWIASRSEESRAEILEEIRGGVWGAEPALMGLSEAERSAVLGEPHVLGWAHQHLGAERRNASNHAHNARESKHADSTVSTQLFTPRWVADFLVSRAAEIVGDGVALDPACGGGQMLLAWVDAMISRGVDVADAFYLVRGMDLDPQAVEICRESLKLHAFRLLGHRDDSVEAQIDQAVQVGDALGAPMEPAAVVITNPPYQGSRSMAPQLRDQLKSRFTPFHHDLYLAFIKRCVELSEDVVCILAQQTLWYLSRFESARRELLDGGHLRSFAHLGPGVFRSLTGEKANVVAFVYQPGARPGPVSFWDLRSMGAEDMREALALDAKTQEVSVFADVPGVPLAHWVPSALLGKFRDFRAFGEIAEIPGSQNKTGANKRFVRLAADANDIRVGVLHPDGVPDGRWVPYSKGGPFSPWWGEWKWVVDWSEEAREFYASNPTSNLLAERYWCREGLTYTDFGGQQFNARWMPEGCVFDMAGPAIFHPEDDLKTLAAWLVLLNSSPARMLLNGLNPSIHYQVRDLRRLPIPEFSSEDWQSLSSLGHKLVNHTQRMVEYPEEAEGLYGALRRMEREAERIACDAYQVASEVAPPVHHLFRGFAT